VYATVTAPSMLPLAVGAKVTEMVQFARLASVVVQVVPPPVVE
jgi:hypothetical protein